MRISWGDAERFYSQGVSNGVLYPQNSAGVSWTGLISVNEKGDDSTNAFYIDGVRFRSRNAPSTYSGTISAFMYPDEFEPYNGVTTGITAQPKSSFGLSYRSNREIHLIYNAVSSPSNDQYASLNADVNPVAFSWDFDTLPMDIPGGRASAHLVVMLDYAQLGAVSDLEDMLYGNDENDPFLPDPQTVYTLFESYTTLTIVDNGDGTWTATGPDSVITMLDANTFQIDWDSAVFIDANTYTIQSL